MIRIVPLALALALVLALIAPAPALADEPPPPTPEQIEAAKKAFSEGKALHEQGKYAEAIEKFKESYRLSRNPLLLYNIGFTMDEAKEADMALFYYRKFLKEAPPEAEQRPAVTDRVKVLEQLFNPTPAEPEPVKPDGPKQPIVIKPLGTYGASDFEHQMIDTAPPAKPLDVTAFVPEDSGFTVTLFFRTAGEGKFANKVMNWRYKELVGRIPAPKMIGTSVQYYIEVKDTAGAVVTRAGRSTSPNLINLEAGAPPRFYPDLTEDGEAVLSASEIRRRDDEDDPLNRGRKAADPDPDPDPIDVGPPPPPGTGFRDVGSTKFRYALYGSTGAAAALLAGSLVFYLQANKYATALEDDSKLCGAPPCQPYDQYAVDVQATGKRYQTLANVSFGVGVAAAAVASYFIYKQVTAKRRLEAKVGPEGKAAPSPEVSAWQVAPVIGRSDAGFFGAAAAKRF